MIEEFTKIVGENSRMPYSLTISYAEGTVSPGRDGRGMENQGHEETIGTGLQDRVKILYVHGKNVRDETSFVRQV